MNLSKITSVDTATIKDIMKLMDRTGNKTIFIINNKKNFLGTVTDGDVRRWILKKGKLSEKVFKIVNKNSIKVFQGYKESQIKKMMVEKQIEHIPILNKKQEIVSFIMWTDLFGDKKERRGKIKLPVVIMAGGIGTRLTPLTHILPKALMPVHDKTITEHIISKLSKQGAKEFYLSLNYKANLIKSYFKDIKKEYKLNYIEEKKYLGTAGSLYLLKQKIKKTFCLINCDIIIDEDYSKIIKFHKEKKNKITIVSSMKHFKIPYGVCELSSNGTLKYINEKPEYDMLVNTGMYIIEPEVLRGTPKNKFYNITDLIKSYIDKKKKVGVYPISEDSWSDMGEFEEYGKMLKKMELL